MLWVIYDDVVAEYWVNVVCGLKHRRHLETEQHGDTFHGDFFAFLSTGASVGGTAERRL